MKRLFGLFLLFIFSNTLLLAQTVRTGRTIRGPLASRPTCPATASPGDIYEAVDQSPILVTVCDSISGWIPFGGSGANPAGNNGDVQARSGDSLQAIGINQTTAGSQTQIRSYGFTIVESPLSDLFQFTTA